MKKEKEIEELKYQDQSNLDVIKFFSKELAIVQAQREKDFDDCLNIITKLKKLRLYRSKSCQLLCRRLEEEIKKLKEQ